MRATQSSSVPARAPDRLLSIWVDGGEVQAAVDHSFAYEHGRLDAARGCGELGVEAEGAWRFRSV